MKHIIILFFLVIAASQSKAQYSVFFCSKLDTSGKCIGKSNEFKWNGEKMPVEVIVEGKPAITATKLNFKVFLMKNDRDGELAAELSVYPKPNATSAVKKVFFFKPGNYKVDVLGADNKMLVSGNVTITER